MKVIFLLKEQILKTHSSIVNMEGISWFKDVLVFCHAVKIKNFALAWAIVMPSLQPFGLQRNGWHHLPELLSAY
jgi:hypothetical protein